MQLTSVMTPKRKKNFKNLLNTLFPRENEKMKQSRNNKKTLFKKREYFHTPSIVLPTYKI